MKPGGVRGHPPWWRAWALCLVMLPLGAAAEYGRVPPSAIDPALLLIDEDEYLGTALEPDLSLVDSTGREFRLGELFDKPLILIFSYFHCDGSCPTLNRAMAKTVLAAKRFRPGADYRVLTLSFDRNDDAASARHFRRKLELPAAGDGWRHAVFRNGEDIERFTGSLGYRFFWSKRDRMFLHPNVFIFVSTEGRAVRFLHGFGITPRDIELAVIEADWKQIGGSMPRVIDLLAGVCFSYNYTEGRYTLNYPIFIAAVSLLGGVALVIFAFTVHRKKKSRRWVHV